MPQTTNKTTAKPAAAKENGMAKAATTATKSTKRPPPKATTATATPTALPEPVSAIPVAENLPPKPIEKPLTETANLDTTVTLGQLRNLRTKDDLAKLFSSHDADPQKIINTIKYEEQLEKLQIELVKLQRKVQEEGLRVAILFEGRDAAGKGGTIRRFTEHLNPRALRVVALPKPTEEEKGQWYFQRYVKQLPNRGEIVFFDRSWYNRAVVEPVMGFCNQQQYETFLNQVTEFEHMLYEDGIMIIKFWFSISKEEQLRRFQSRLANPLKQWKISPVDMQAQDMWDKYTRYKEEMFSKTHTSFSPWIIVKANNKQKARLESIRYVLFNAPYTDNNQNHSFLFPDPNIIVRYHRKAITSD